MSLTAAALKKMHELGLTLEQAIELAEVWEAGAAQPMPQLSKGALRTRKWREKNQQASPCDVTETHNGDVSHVGERSQVVVSSLPSLRSEEVVVGGVGSAGAKPAPNDWPEGKADHHAKLLVEAAGSPWLDPNKSPDLVTTRGRVAAWKRDGASWEHDVLPVVIGLCGNRRSRISSWKFFDAAVSRSIAENRAALEIPIFDPRKANERSDHSPAFLRKARNLAAAEAGFDRMVEARRARSGDGGDADPFG